MQLDDAQAAGHAARRTRKRVRLILALAGLPTLAAVLLAALGPITSGDLWWHLRTGRWILAEGRLPTTDPFSHTAGDTHWVLQEYGSQVLFALVHRVGGFEALAVLAAALSLAVLGVVRRRARRDLPGPWALAATAIFALLFALKWELRPHLVSLLFFFWLEANLLGRCTGRTDTPGPRRLLELFVISMVWVQLHAEALFAPLLCLAVATGAWVAVLREGAGLRHGAAWLGMVAAATLGTLASPLVSEPHRYALVGRAAPQRYIEEWFRPWVLPGDPRFAPLDLFVWGAYLAALAVGGTFALGALARRLGTAPGASRLDGDGRLLARAVSWERLAFLAGCLLFALSARRFFWLTWFPLLAAAGPLVGGIGGRELARRGREAVVGLVLPAALAAGAGVALLGTHYPAQARASLAAGRFDALVDPALFPAHAADFATEAGLTGNLYHPYEWGGYLGYVTGQPVFIDGRTVLFEEVIPERWTAERDPAARARVLDDRDVEVIVFKHFVDHGQGWRPWWPGEAWLPVWTDQLARVFVRRGSDDHAAAEAWWLAHGVALDGRHGITEAEVFAVRPDWLRAKALLPAELADVLEATVTGDERAGAFARLRLWGTRNLRRNLRAELRLVVRDLEARVPEQRWLEPERLATLRARLDRDDLAGLLDDLSAWEEDGRER